MSLCITSTCVGGRHVSATHEAPAPAPKPQPVRAPGPFETLTPRERHVLDVYMEQGTAKLAARALGLSFKTVEIHLVSIKAKAETPNLLRLARAYERNLLEEQQGGCE